MIDLAKKGKVSKGSNVEGSQVTDPSDSHGEVETAMDTGPTAVSHAGEENARGTDDTPAGQEHVKQVLHSCWPLICLPSQGS